MNRAEEGFSLTCCLVSLAYCSLVTSNWTQASLLRSIHGCSIWTKNWTKNTYHFFLLGYIEAIVSLSYFVFVPHLSLTISPVHPLFMFQFFYLSLQVDAKSEIRTPSIFFFLVCCRHSHGASWYAFSFTQYGVITFPILLLLYFSQSLE